MLYFAVGMPGPFEWAIILIIVLMFFGLGKLPKVMAQLGKGVRSFKDGVKGGDKGETGPDQIDVTPEDGDAVLDEAIEVGSDEVKVENS